MIKSASVDEGVIYKETDKKARYSKTTYNQRRKMNIDSPLPPALCLRNVLDHLRQDLFKAHAIYLGRPADSESIPLPTLSRSG